MHSVLYHITSCNAMQGIAPGTVVTYAMSPWKVWMFVIDGIIAILLCLAAFCVRRRVKNNVEA